MDKEYWRNRSVTRLVASEGTGNTAIIKIADIYNSALRNIDRDVKSIYDNYSEKGILNVSELKKALSPAEKAIFLRKVAASARKLRLRPEDVYDERYLDRLTRLEALKEQIRMEVYSTAPGVVAANEDAYTEILEKTYRDTQEAVRIGGATLPFSTLNSGVVNTILASQWYGRNYSSTIWGNTDVFAQELPSIIGGAVASGQSYQRTTKQLKDRFGVTTREAARLVRTETNYFRSQAELQSYIDDGIEEYEFYAILDKQTSNICRDLDGEIFRVEDAEPGKNYPPMHPNCRSTTLAKLRGDPAKPKGYNRLSQDFDKAFEKVEERIGQEKLASGTGEFGLLNNKLNYLSGNQVLQAEMAKEGFVTTAAERATLAKRIFDDLSDPKNFNKVLRDKIKAVKFKSKSEIAAATTEIEALRARGTLITSTERMILENAMQQGTGQVLSADTINNLTPESFANLQRTRRLELGKTNLELANEYRTKIVDAVKSPEIVESSVEADIQARTFPEGFKAPLKDLSVEVGGESTYYDEVDNVVRIRRYTDPVERKEALAHELSHAYAKNTKLITTTRVDDVIYDAYDTAVQEFMTSENIDDFDFSGDKINGQIDIADKYKKLFPDMPEREFYRKFSRVMDTLESTIGNGYGFGHGQQYYARDLTSKYQEFFAHAGENYLVGNEVFEKLYPKTYKKTVDLFNRITK